ncbi:MAG: hypothetical protein V1901_03900 [Patescibacteria group bacterium]
MKLIIEEADNGYVLIYYSGTQEKGFISIEEDSNGCKARTTQKLLYAIVEYFEILGSKHDEERIKISVIDQRDKEIDKK